MVRYLLLLSIIVITDPYEGIQYLEPTAYYYETDDCWEGCIHVTEAEGGGESNYTNSSEDDEAPSDDRTYFTPSLFDYSYIINPSYRKY
jgi:hypothetical protein